MPHFALPHCLVQGLYRTIEKESRSMMGATCTFPHLLSVTGFNAKIERIHTIMMVRHKSTNVYVAPMIELAEALGKSRDGVSKWVRRGTLRHAADPDFAAAVEVLDQAASEEP